MPWVCHNGSFSPADQPLFPASNRGFKYGDGLFETATFHNGRLLLSHYHFDRLFSGLRLLDITADFTATQLIAAVTELCERNGCTACARVRIAVYREEANQASYVIEAMALDAQK